MAGYDSDSDFEQELSETNVLLGYASKDAGDDSISRLGGVPVSPKRTSCQFGMSVKR